MVVKTSKIIAIPHLYAYVFSFSSYDESCAHFLNDLKHRKILLLIPLFSCALSPLSKPTLEEVYPLKLSEYNKKYWYTI